MPGIPLPGGTQVLTPASTDLLEQARQNAAASLREAMPDAQSPSVQSPVHRPAQAQVTNEPPPDAVAPVNNMPPSDAKAIIEPASKPTITGAVVDSTKETGRELGNGLARGALWAAHALGFAAATAMEAGDAMSAGDEGLKRPQKDPSSDAVFGFLKNHVDTAFDYWSVPEAESNPAARIVGHVAEAAAPLLVGQPEIAFPMMVGSAATHAGKASIDRGEDVKTAALLSTISATAAAVGMKIPFKSPSVAKRIASSVGLGVPVNVTAELLTKEVLKDRGYQEAAAQIDPFDPESLATSGILQVIFGVLAGPRVQKKLKEARKTESPDTPPNIAAAPPPDAVSPLPVDAEAAPARPDPPPPVRPAQPPAEQLPLVPDNPSAEPAMDLMAQKAALLNKAHPRKGVYLSQANIEALPIEQWRELRKGLVELRDFDGKGGSILVADNATKLRALAARKKVNDPTKLIGKITGAGEGKTPEQTMVVQGRTPEGAVASEGAVTPEEVPTKVAEVKAQGEIPVVTTAAEAVARREELLSTQVAEFKAGDRVILRTPNGERGVVVDGPEVKGKIPVKMIDDEGNVLDAVVKARANLLRRNAIATEPLPPIESAPPTPPAAEKLVASASKEAVVSATAEPVAPKAARLKAAVAAKIESTPASGSDRTAEVTTPPEAVVPTEGSSSGRTSELGSENLGSNPSPSATVRKGTAIPDLEKAATNLRTQDTLPEGTARIKGSLADRASRVASFAKVLKASAMHAFENKLADEPAINRAADAARAAEKLDQKSTEDVAKGRGVSHRSLDDHVTELLRASDELQGRAAPARNVEQEISVKRKARLDKARAAIKKEQAEKIAPKPEPKVDSGIKVDETEATSANKGLREISKEEKRSLNLAVARYTMASGHDGAAFARKQVQNLLLKFYPQANSKVHDELLQAIDDARAEAQGTAARPSRDQEVDEEVTPPTGIDYQTASKDDFASPAERLLDSSPATAMWQSLADNLNANGYFDAFNAKGSMVGRRTHSLLNGMLGHLDADSPLHDVLSHLVKHMPDIPVRPVDKITTRGGKVLEGAAGLYTPGPNPAIQVARLPVSPQTVRIMVHEMAHAATLEFVRHNPEHALTKEINYLYKEALARARGLRGDEQVLAHWRYFNSLDPALKPAFLDHGLYGLANVEEFIAEAYTNPKFQRLLIESELAAKPGDKHPQTIWTRFSAAIASMFGIKKPQSADLLHRVLHISDKIIEAQGREFRGEDTRTLEDVYAALDENEGFRDAAAHARLARATTPGVADRAVKFTRSIRKGAVGALRRTLLPLETQDFLIRRNLHHFGAREDANNPLRAYDEADIAGVTRAHEITHRAAPVFERWGRLPSKENEALGQFMIDSTTWGIDPTIPAAKHAMTTQGKQKFTQRYAEYVARWNNLTPESQQIYKDLRDTNRWALRKARNAAIDTVLHAYSDTEIPAAARSALYSAGAPSDFATMVGESKMIDIGDRNTRLLGALQELAGANQIAGPFFHLGRHGDFVVQINPEGEKLFPTRALAESFADEVRDLSPGSNAVVAEHEGRWTVEYEADYVSMHRNERAAEAELETLRARGFDVGPVTAKINNQESSMLSGGMQHLVGEVTRKISRRGLETGESDEGVAALNDALKNAVATMVASRSAYAASKLTRKGTGGVKAPEMMRNSAEHLQSLGWNIGQLSSVFAKGEALGRIREFSKNPVGVTGSTEAIQKTMYSRGAVMTELNNRLKQDAAQNGIKGSALNSAVAKLNFMAYLASPAHTIVNFTQNFQITTPMAAARWGPRAVGSLHAAQTVIAGSAFRNAFLAHFKPSMGNTDVANAILEAARTSPRFARIARGQNSPLEQLIRRNVITASFSNEVANMAQGGPRVVDRVVEWARIAPHMVEVFNRVSTALTALEMTNGNVVKASDFVKEVHFDYSQQNKSRVMKSLGKGPLRGVTTFKTYVQGLTQTLYSALYDSFAGQARPRAEAAKAFAGMMFTTSLMAGTSGALLLEPVKLAYYMFQKFFGDDNDPAVQLDTAMDNYFGELVSRGLPHGINVDVSERLGFSNLLVHNPPDLLRLDTKEWAEFAGNAVLGPFGQLVARNGHKAMQAFGDGDYGKGMAALAPVKGFQDAAAAYDLAQVGTMDKSGGHLTQPSAGNALVKLLGFQPAGLADARHRQSAVYDRSEKVFNRKDELIARGVRKGWGAIAADVADFNKKNPAQAIRAQDLLKQRRKALTSEAVAEGRAGRDPNVNEILGH